MHTHAYVAVSLPVAHSNSYTGGTVVDGGTLLVTDADALPPGHDLTIELDGSMVLESGLTKAIELSSLSFLSGPASDLQAASSASGAHAVPEPTAVSLLVAGAIAMALMGRTRRKRANCSL